MNNYEKSALKICKNCGNKMAKNDTYCSYCSTKNNKPIHKRVWFWLIIVVIIIALIFGTFITYIANSFNMKKAKDYLDMEKTEFISICEPYDNKAYRNDSEYIEKSVAIQLRVVYRNGDIYFARTKNEKAEKELLKEQERRYNEEMIWYEQQLNMYEEFKENGWEKPSIKPTKEPLDPNLVWTGNNYILYNFGENKLLQGDIVTVYGIYNGESEIFTNAETPSITVLYYDFLEE